MKINEAGDRRKHNRLVLALKRALEAKLDESTWKELGYATDTIDWINGHHRLLRSLHWGDHDYGSCVLDAVEHILERDPANVEVILDFPGVKDWLQVNEPEVYADYCGDEIPAVRTLADAQEAGRGFDVDAHIHRIRESLTDDPAQALGSTKELLESVFKAILGMHGAKVGCDEMPKLWKRTQAALGLDPADIDDTMPGADSFRRLLGGMTHIVVAATELRNLYGTGHGKSNAPGLDPPMANLVVAAATSLAAYLMHRYREMKGR